MEGRFAGLAVPRACVRFNARLRRWQPLSMCFLMRRADNTGEQGLFERVKGVAAAIKILHDTELFQSSWNSQSFNSLSAGWLIPFRALEITTDVEEVFGGELVSLLWKQRLDLGPLLRHIVENRQPITGPLTVSA